MVVRPGYARSFRRATRPVSTSSFVVPPINGLKTEFASPNTPWQDAHLPSQTSWPLATLPEPAGRPLKSGRTSMSQAATSLGVAARPMPEKRASCACAELPATSTKTRASSRNLDIPHLAVRFHHPRLDGVVVIDRAGAAHLAQLPVVGLHVAGAVDRAALQQGGLAIPDPVQVEA